MCHSIPSDAMDLGSNLPFGELFFSLSFQTSNHIRKAFISNKIEENNQIVENKVLGRIRVGVGRAFFPNKVHPDFKNRNTSKQYIRNMDIHIGIK